MRTVNKFENMNDFVSYDAELITLVEGTTCLLNGDPKENGDQRTDKNTEKAEVSAFRIKRVIRDDLSNRGHVIFVSEGEEGKPVPEETRRNEIMIMNGFKEYKNIKKEKVDIPLVKRIIPETCIDGRLFGNALSAHVTGCFQFKHICKSLNKIEKRTIDITSNFTSDVEKKSGAMGDSRIAEYVIIPFTGSISKLTALHNKCTNADILEALAGIWEGFNMHNSCVGNNYQCKMLLYINYKNPDENDYPVKIRRKIGNLHKSFEMEIIDEDEEFVRQSEDYIIKIDNLMEMLQYNEDIVKNIYIIQYRHGMTYKHGETIVDNVAEYIDDKMNFEVNLIPWGEAVNQG